MLVFLLSCTGFEQVIQLVKIFWDICALKAAPQDLPASTFLLGLVLLAYFITGVIVAAFQWPLSQALLAAFQRWEYRPRTGTDRTARRGGLGRPPGRGLRASHTGAGRAP